MCSPEFYYVVAVACADFVLGMCQRQVEQAQREQEQRVKLEQEQAAKVAEELKRQQMLQQEVSIFGRGSWSGAPFGQCSARHRLWAVSSRCAYAFWGNVFSV